MKELLLQCGLIDILNPEVIILGSIYGRAKSLLEPFMREMLEKEAITYSYQHCRIVPAGLSENIGDIAALTLAIESSYLKKSNAGIGYK